MWSQSERNRERGLNRRALSLHHYFPKLCWWIFNRFAKDFSLASIVGRWLELLAWLRWTFISWLLKKFLITWTFPLVKSSWNRESKLFEVLTSFSKIENNSGLVIQTLKWRGNDLGRLKTLKASKAVETSSRKCHWLLSTIWRRWVKIVSNKLYRKPTIEFAKTKTWGLENAAPSA